MSILANLDRRNSDVRVAVLESDLKSLQRDIARLADNDNKLFEALRVDLDKLLKATNSNSVKNSEALVKHIEHIDSLMIGNYVSKIEFSQELQKLKQAIFRQIATYITVIGVALSGAFWALNHVVMK